MFAPSSYRALLYSTCKEYWSPARIPDFQWQVCRHGNVPSIEEPPSPLRFFYSCVRQCLFFTPIETVSSAQLNSQCIFFVMHFSLGLVGILATTPLLLQAAPTPDQDVGESPNNKFGNPDGPAWVLGRPPNKFPAKPGDGPAWTLGRPPNKFPADPGDGPTWTLGRPPNKFNNNGGGGLRPDPQPFQGESAIYHPPKKPVVGIGRTFYNGKRVENGHPAGTSYGKHSYAFKGRRTAFRLRWPRDARWM